MSLSTHALLLTLIFLASETFAASGTLFKNLDVPEDFKGPVSKGLSPEQIREHSFKSNGTQISYWVAGNHGPWIVMIHGFVDYSWGWRDQIRDLSRSFRVVALDLPGFNDSEAGQSKERYKAETIASDIGNLMDHLGAKRAYIMGHDLGGWLGWHFAMLNPEKTAGMIAINSPHPNGYLREYYSNPLQKQASEYFEFYRNEKNFDSIENQDLSSWIIERREKPKYERAMESSSVRAMLDYYVESDIRPPEQQNLPKVKAPALVIQGLDDEQVRPETLNSTWDWIQGPVTLITLPGVKHDIQREKASWLSRQVANWIDEQERKKVCKSIGKTGSFCVEQISDFAPDGYRLKTADLDGDGLPDIIHIGGPISWISSKDQSSHLISHLEAKDFIDIAPGVVEGKHVVAAAGDFNFSNTSSGGELWLYTQPDDSHTPLSTPWSRKLIDQVPTLHRLNWIDVMGDGQNELLGTPLFGKDARGIGFDEPPAPLILWIPGVGNKDWKKQILDASLHGIHGMEVVHWYTPSDILTASMEGITLFRNQSKAGNISYKKISISKGDQTRKNLKGAGEVTLGKNEKKQNFLAAIEPWHGDHVVVYENQASSPSQDSPQWIRHVIDHSSSGGHSILAMDFLGIGNDQVLACFFGKNPGVFLFERENSNHWKKTQLIEAPFDCEDLYAVDLHHQGKSGVLAISDVSHEIKYITFEKNPD